MVSGVGHCGQWSGTPWSVEWEIVVSGVGREPTVVSVHHAQQHDVDDDDDDDAMWRASSSACSELVQRSTSTTFTHVTLLSLSLTLHYYYSPALIGLQQECRL